MDELPGYAMQFEYIVQVQLGHPLSSECCVSGKDMDLLAEPVNKDTNGIVSTGFRKFTNEVHRDHLPWLFGDLIRLKGSVGAIPVCLGALASFAAIHIHPGISLETWPPVVTCDELLCLVATWVASNGCVMVHANDVFAQLGVLGHIDPPLPGQEALILLPLDITWATALETDLSWFFCTCLILWIRD